MQYVCDDAGPSKWFFAEERDTYLRIYDDGRFAPVIKGMFVPNPEDLWNARINKAQSEGRKPDVAAMKPTEAVYALWGHWNKRFDR